MFAAVCLFRGLIPLKLTFIISKIIEAIIFVFIFCKKWKEMVFNVVFLIKGPAVKVKIRN
jgi:hypothetical protein